MKLVSERPLTASPQPRGTTVLHRAPHAPRRPSRCGRLNVLRVGYLFMGGGLAMIKWPLLFGHPTWGVAEGTKECLFMALSFLALLGLRYPLPDAAHLAVRGHLEVDLARDRGAPRLAGPRPRRGLAHPVRCGRLVVVIIAVIPWRYVFAQFVIAPADPWRRRSSTAGV